MPSLTNGTRYYFRLRATSAGGDSPVAQATIQLAASPSAAVTISDGNLRTALERALGKSAGATITQLEMASLTSLASLFSSIAVLDGIGHAVNLTTLDLWGNAISDVTPLGTLTSLTRLNLRTNSITDVSALGTLTSLTELRLPYNSITDISALGTLTSLTWLSLGYNSITDITPLGTLTSLTWLNLSSNSIADVSALGTLTSLTSLQLSSNAISDLTAIGSLTSLTFLNLSDNSINDVSTIGSLTSLTSLWLHRNSISDVMPLGTLTSLTSLRLGYNSIADVTGLGTLTSLTRLDLDNNVLTGVTGLGTLTSLTWLDLANNSITDVAGLGTLSSLTRLNLADNSLASVTALGTLTSLTTLRLTNTTVTDVAPLGTLTSLTRLYLYNNSINDVRGLGMLTSLKLLELGSNSLTDITPLGTLTSLVNLGLASNSISDVSNLSDLEHLSFVDLHDNRIATVGPLAEGEAFSTPIGVEDSEFLDALDGFGDVFLYWSDRLQKRTAFELLDGPILHLTGNSLDVRTIETDIPRLERKGVRVYFDRTPIIRPNRTPEAAGELAELALAVGEIRWVDLCGSFIDPDGDELTYLAWSSDESVATAWVFGSQLRVRGEGVGVVDVQVRATDPGGLSATQRLRATVGAALSLAADGEVREGETVRLGVTLSTPRDAATTFGWRVVADEDSATADADAGEHGGASGELTIPAGETTTEIAIAIADDDDIEPAREWFEVLLYAPADGCCALRQPRARVVVLEGVCDRTPAVADALRGDGPCTAPTPASLAGRTRLTVVRAGTLRTGDLLGLAGLRWLSLSGNGLAALPERLFVGLGALRELNLAGNTLTTLPPAPFQALPRLRILDLSANGFETLPAGLFAGLSLREASLEGNPGAPFALAAELVRTDAAEPWAPGPATLEARLPSGAPFPLRLPLTAEPAADGLPAMLGIPAGATSGEAFAVSAPSAGALTLRAGAATPPAATCGAEWPFRACFRGLTPEPGATLTLFRQPPRALPAPQPEALAGDDLRLPLASLVAAGDAPGTLRWQASSSDESVATVRVIGGELVVEPELATEGVTEIVLVATDSAGLVATVRFEVRVEFFAPPRHSTGWRSALLQAAPVPNHLSTED